MTQLNMGRVRELAEVIWATWKVEPEVALMYALADEVMRKYAARPAPQIISGLRTHEKQRWLYNRWRANPDAHQRPARFSWHLPNPDTGLGRAIDLTKSDPIGLQWFSYLWKLMGGQPGSEFGDPNHFQLPKGQRPEPAW